MLNTRIYGIVGAGPLGLALAHRLKKSGLDVGVFARHGAVAAKGIVDGERLDTCTCRLEDCSVVLSAVPAYAVGEALATHAAHLAPGTAWINLSNGMVWDELASASKRYANLLPRAGSVRFGAKDEAGAIVTSGATDVCWGPLSPGQPTAAEEALARLDGWHWDPDVKKRLILKWIYNSVLNSLCAAKNWSRNGEALRHWAMIPPLVSEAVALAKELWDEDFDAALVSEGLKTLIEKTAANENSMVRALRRGVRTEHPALLGWVHRAHGLYPKLLRLARDVEAKSAG